jgi:hypothetical protein
MMQILFSTAVNKFSKDSKVRFDFMQAAMQDQPLLSKGYLEHLNNFFGSMCMHYRNSLSIENFIAESAAAKFSERFLDYIHHFTLRNNIPLAEAPKIMQQMIEEIDKMVRPFLPCAATKYFNEIGKLVFCESNFVWHKNGHQSAQTYPLKIPKDVFFGNLFGKTDTITQACRWDGDFETHANHVPVGWFVNPNIFNQVHTLATADFKHNHKQVLESHKDIYCKVASTPLTYQTCFGCLLNFPSEVLACRHALCSACCKELCDGGIVQCPFCNMAGDWHFIEVPDGAGPRVLTISDATWLKERNINRESGSGADCGAVILAKIEERLNIPIHELFDLIVGSETGIIPALSCGVLRRPAKEVVEKWGSDFCEYVQQLLLFLLLNDLN